MAEPQRAPAPAQAPSIEEQAALRAAAQKMMRVDPLAEMAESLMDDLNQLAGIFNEESRKLEAANRNLPENEQKLPDFNRMKDFIDTKKEIINTLIEMRREQREEIVFAGMHRPQQPGNKGKTAGFDFGTKK